jgi:outer membrane protein assembly factor BamB
MWGFSGSPIIEGDALICLGSGDVAVAFNKDTGKVLWSALKSKEPGYSSPAVIESGGTRQLIIFYPEAVASLNPQTGQVYWSEPFSSKMGLSVATPRCEGDLLFVTSFYDGSLMLRLDRDKAAATKVWQKKGKNEAHEDVLHAMLCTPFLRDGYIYGVSSYGQLRCLKADTGEKVWETFAATSGEGGQVRWSNAFIVANGDRFFLANEHGDLIIARLTPAGYEEISRTHLIEPTNKDPGRLVVWSHPAFANRRIYLRNDKELVCASLAAEK